jgi:hypothetical protein
MKSKPGRNVDDNFDDNGDKRSRASVFSSVMKTERKTTASVVEWQQVCLSNRSNCCRIDYFLPEHLATLRTLILEICCSLHNCTLYFKSTLPSDMNTEQLQLFEQLSSVIVVCSASVCKKFIFAMNEEKNILVQRVV